MPLQRKNHNTLRKKLWSASGTIFADVFVAFVRAGVRLKRLASFFVLCVVGCWMGTCVGVVRAVLFGRRRSIAVVFAWKRGTMNEHRMALLFFFYRVVPCLFGWELF